MSDQEAASSGIYYYRYPSTRADGSLRPPEKPVRPGHNSAMGSPNVYIPPAKREIDSWANDEESIVNVGNGNGNGNGIVSANDGVSTTANASITTAPTTAPTTATTPTTTATHSITPSVTSAIGASMTTQTADRVDEISWAEEESPVVKKFTESEGEQESDHHSESTATAPVPPKREPSKLATAIDDALDTLSLDSSNGSNSNGERQIGRFAAQIKNEQRGDYSQQRGDYSQQRFYQPRYNDQRRPYNDQQQQQQRPYEQRGYYNNDLRRGHYGNEYNNTSSQSSNTASTTVATMAPQSGEKQTSSTSSLSPSQSYGECPRLRSSFETLSKCRREMAIINAKLEYIRYMRAAKDEEDLSPVERERVSQEAALLTKINSIYEQIEALEI